MWPCWLGVAWPLALIPSNLIAGFCKSGIYPLNPGRIADRELGPSKSFPVENEESQSNSLQSPPSSLSVTTMADSTPCLPSTSGSIDEILRLPKPKTHTRKKAT